jgi:hypothetical protein
VTPRSRYTGEPYDRDGEHNQQPADEHQRNLPERAKYLHALMEARRVPNVVYPAPFLTN